MKNNNIYVTMPTLASLSDVNALLEGVWERGVMTHNGPLVQRFEKEVAEFLNILVLYYRYMYLAIHVILRR